MKFFSFLSFCLLLNTSFSQTLNWAYSFPNQVVQEGITDLSAAAELNLFAIIGYGNNGISMDVNGNTNFNSSGYFLAVYGQGTAAIQWIKPTTAYTFGVFIDNSSNVYTCGKNNGNSFLDKYDANGNLQWSSSASIDGNATEIKVKSNGNIIVSGVSSAQASVTLSNNQQVTINPGIYFLEFSASGILLGAYSIEKIDGNTNVSLFDMTIDDNDNIYVCGQLDGQLDFDPTSAQNFNSTTNSYDAFVCKLSQNFDLSWYKTFGDSNNPAGWDKARAVKVDPYQNVYVGGEFTWTTTFDDGTNPLFTLTSDNNSQVPSGYFLQYDASGNLNWVNKIGNENTTSSSDYASVSVKDLIVSEFDVIALIEGYGVVDMDPSDQVTVYETNGTTSSNAFFIGQYINGTDYHTSFSIGSDQTMSNTSAVGFEKFNGSEVVVAGTFQKIVDFDPSSQTVNLECQQGTFYSFDNDLFIASYQLTEFWGVNELSNNHKQRCYPNPFTDELNFDTMVDKISVYSLNGKLILESENIQKLNTTNIEKGSYLIKTEIGNKVSTFKLVK